MKMILPSLLYLHLLHHENARKGAQVHQKVLKTLGSGLVEEVKSLLDTGKVRKTEFSYPSKLIIVT
jgi:hypothetical protein